MVQGGHVRRLPLERPVSLLVYLAVRGGWVERREAARLYRQDAPETEALAYLRKLVFRARRHEWADALEVEADALRWRVSTDVARFTAAALKADWATALAVYGGPFLGGARLERARGFAAWRDAEEAALETAMLRASTELARLHEAAGRLEEAAGLHRDLLAHDPFAETSVQALLRLLPAADRRQEALAVYETFRAALEAELGAAPLDATEALADDLRRPAPGRAGAPAGAPAAPTSLLPAPGTPFVGRESEMRTLMRLLQGDAARLVTLVGLGGTGKTRLALEAASALGAGGLDVAFVPLVAATTTVDVAATVLRALDLPWEDGSTEEALMDGLKRRHMLLVLDNFEGALGAAPLLAHLLARAPGVRLLVTSREPLELHGEWLFDVGGLATPPEGLGPQAARYDAVRLYVQQAARLTQGRQFSAEELEEIGRLCRLLGGLPLGIELAATWSPLLSPSELRLEIERDPRMLVSRRRDLPERHRSLWRVFDYTWGRLTGPERSALLALTAFPASFGLAAARNVTGSELATLIRLLDLKLMRRPGVGRFELHQLVKQYVQQRGAADEAVERAREAHSRHYCGFLEEVTADLDGNDVHAGLASVQAELPNVLAAWQHALARADHEALDRVRDAVNNYFYYRSDFATACGLFGAAAKALDDANEQRDEIGRAAASRVAGRLLVHHSEHERHRSRLAHSIEIANAALTRLEEVGNEVDVAYAKLNLGTTLIRMSQYQPGDRLVREVLSFSLRTGEVYLQGAAHNALANLLSYTEGNMTEAEEHYRASLRANRKLGNLEGINGALINLGACRFDVGDLEGAMGLWQEAAEMAAQLGYKQREAVLHNNLGSLFEVQGRLEEAEERYRLSLSVRREIDDRSGQANALHNLGRLAAGRGEAEKSRRKLTQALEVFIQIEEPAGEAHVRSSLARLLAGQGNEDDARSEAHAALELALKLGSRSDILGSLFTVALLHERAGELVRAADLASQVAEAAAGSMEPLRAEALKLIDRTAEGARPRVRDELGRLAHGTRGQLPAESARTDAELLHVAKLELSTFRP